jgi:SET domain-containing protein
MDKHIEKKWGTRWLTHKATVFLSLIHNTGVQAVEPIKKDEVVAVLGGLIVHKSQIKEYWKTEGHVGIQIHDEFYIVPPNREELKKYGVFNHSCDPNIGFMAESNILYAIKDIAPEEELVFDYAFCELDKPAFRCNCHSVYCRFIITPDDWKNESLQNRFGKYFAPFVRAKLITP